MKNKGIIYYNSGTKCLVRLLVSIHSLRKIYPKVPVTILSRGDMSHEVCEKISSIYGADIKDVEYDVEDGRNKILLEKCLCHTKTPYDISIFLDTDTLIVRKFADDLWGYAESHEFSVPRFSSWKSNTRPIAKRINQWALIYPDLIDKALNFGPAVNTGVFSFRKDAKIMEDWFDMAVRGRRNFIPDEICCQIILHKYPHKVADQKYNASSKYSDIDDEDIRIIHYHGKKHCRLNKHGDMIFGSDKWIKVYNEIVENNVADILNWQPAGDRMLRKYIKLTLSRRLDAENKI